MTAREVLNAKAGQRVGLGNGLRLVCDKRNDGRYFELRKRVRNKDYSWGVGNVENLTIAGCGMFSCTVQLREPHRCRWRAVPSDHRQFGPKSKKPWLHDWFGIPTG